MAERLAVGQVIRDTYTVVKHLGSGAFGDVYLARHRYMGLQALKIFVRNEGNDALEEAYLLTKLSHPNIVRMFEANDFELGGDGFGYFSMEYVEGGSLLGLIDSSYTLNDRLTLGKDILSGLAFAHDQTPPVIHRDISPSNILVERSKRGLKAKISDFGLAKHVDSESLIASAAGKYVYMAPESFLGIHSTATDVYSAAIVLFEVFTGQHPFRTRLSVTATAAEVAALVQKSREQAVPDVSDFATTLDPKWNMFFQSALAHEHERRPTTAGDLLELYASMLDGANTQCASKNEDVEAVVTEAKRLALQSETLGEAVALLEQVCLGDPKVRSEYSQLLMLWKRGIVL